MTSQQVSAAVSEIQTTGDLILQEIQTLDPAVALPAGVAEMLLDLAGKAVSAWTGAAGVPITAENLEKLLPNSAPLSPPQS